VKCVNPYQVVCRFATLANNRSEKWKWESPLIARFGRVTGKVAVMSLLDPVAQYLGYKWREIHFVICEDIQVFIEKRRNVFNFHLLDESLNIPEPEIILAGLNSNNQSTTETVGNDNADSSADKVWPNKSLENGSESNLEDDQQIAPVDSVYCSFDNAEASNNVPGDSAEKKANELVSSMLKTVSTIGKAANKGGKDELERVFKNQRDNIVKTLREFQETQQRSPKGKTDQLVPVDGKSKGNPSNVVRKSSMEVMARESLKVVRSMGKAVERNVSEIQQSLKPPQKKTDYHSEDDLLRIGWLVFRDVRIFTKDVILSSNTGTSPKKNGDTSHTASRTDSSRWSIPILLKEVAFGGTDLSNPASVRDADGLPIIGVEPEKLVDILTRRALSEMAKTNTGRLFSNAMGEFFAWVDSVGANANAPRP